jgi:hypothetical protein
MTQHTLPFEYESEQNSTGLTALAGLPVFLELMAIMGLPQLIRDNLSVRPDQGWTDTQQIVALLSLHLAGGDCMDDLDKLEADEGFCQVLEEVENHGLRARERKALKCRWRVEKQRSVPSPTALRHWLKEFDDAEQSALSKQGGAFVPAPNEHLSGLKQIVAETARYAHLCAPQTTATLDGDATLIATSKAEALYSYKKHKAYQPYNIFWDELGVMVASEFRDGNCPAAWRILPVFKQTLEVLPPEVAHVRCRQDTAAYQSEFLKYMAEGHHPRFGVIKFAVSVDVTRAFKKAVAQVEPDKWKPYKARGKDGLEWETGQEYAEVCYVPTWAGHKKDGPEYRFIAIREPLDDQPELFEDDEQPRLPFPTMAFADQCAYKLFGVVTNYLWDEMDADEVIRWQRLRGGNSEKAHSILKRDLGGGQLPSGKFGANAAWWQIALIAFNLHVIMQTRVLEHKGLGQRLKGVRFGLIGVPGRIIRHARRLIIRVPKNHPSLQLIERARHRLDEMKTGPPGRWLAAA